MESLPDIGACHSVAWSPDGNEIEFGLESGQVHVWNRDTKTGRFLPGIHIGRVSDIRFSPDSQLLASSGVEDLTRIWNARGNQMLVRLTERMEKLQKHYADTQPLHNPDAKSSDEITPELLRERVKSMKK